MKVVFILGSGHCGSTLLDLLLSSHKKVCGVGELHKLKGYIENGNVCTCHKAINNCSLWSDIIQDFDTDPVLKVDRDKIDFLLNNRTFTYVDNSTQIDKETYISEHEHIYQAIVDATECEIIVDSSKKVNRVELLKESNIIDPVVIHLVRDGRGVLWSYKKKYSNTISFIWKWIAENMKTEIIRQRNNLDSILVRYKDLASDTETELQKILKFIGLQYNPSILQFRDKEQHQVGGNRMRLKSGSEIKEDTEWKERLSLSDKMLFWLLAGWLQIRYFN